MGGGGSVCPAIRLTTLPTGENDGGGAHRGNPPLDNLEG